MADAGYTDEADVVVVGFGPVGATLAVMLAQQGHRVTALDQWAEPYTLPRATSFDGYAARLLADAGMRSRLSAIGEPANGYDWRNAAGDTLLRIPLHQVGRYGWPDATTMHQPALEAAIADRARDLPNLTVLRGHRVSALRDDGDKVHVTAEVTAGDPVKFTASWVVGCDGANSFVREQVRAPLSDLGFSYDWLLCDIALRQPREFRPTNIQLCDPERPTTMVGSGPGRRRFEFMRMPGESTEWLNRSGTAWRLLSRFDITPATAKLLRHATYTFRSSWVTRWRTGRIMLAGDASHLMPPFTGQGMCTGLQDVANLAWKLDLVLRGVVATDLLDSYGEERSEQAEGAVRASVQLGKVICVDDPKAARDRDVAMLARARQAGTSGPQPAAALTTGLLHRADDGKVAAGAGEVFPQARVTFRERSDLLDEICRTGANRPGVPGFLLLTTDTEGQRLDHTDLDDEARALLHILETTFVTVITSGTPGVGALVDDVVRVGDLDDVYLRYLSSSGSRAVLVRPDHHVFGTASTPEGLSALVRQLGHDLALPRLSVA